MVKGTRLTTKLITLGPPVTSRGGVCRVWHVVLCGNGHGGGGPVKMLVTAHYRVVYIVLLLYTRHGNTVSRGGWSRGGRESTRPPDQHTRAVVVANTERAAPWRRHRHRRRLSNGTAADVVFTPTDTGHNNKATTTRRIRSALLFAFWPWPRSNYRRPIKLRRPKSLSLHYTIVVIHVIYIKNI